MTPEIRRAAVRMAAKTALVMTLGCSSGKSAPTAPIGNTGNGSASPVEAPCGEYLASLPTAKPGELPEGDPMKDKQGVYGAFAKPEDRVAARTQSCCAEALAKDGASTPQRWECCSAVDNKVPAGDQTGACTPWGPPCPPEMV